MGIVLRSIEKQLPEIAAQCAEVRRERNLSARRRRREAQGWAIEARRLDAQTRAKLIRADRELERLLRFRIRIRPEDRPKLSGRTARKLYDHAERLIGGIIGTSDVRGRDGLYGLYFGWRSRGLGAQEGRAWRPGEAARFVRYITRETALEAGEDGWFSNIGEDREELVAFFRALESIERADRDNANVYISIVVPLPYDLDAAGRRKVAALITDALAVRGLPFVAALHLPDPGGDQRNFHLHVQLSLRPFERHGPCDWTFSAAKQTQLNTGAGIALMKRHAVIHINRVLAEQKIDRRYTHRPRARRGEAAGEMKRRRGRNAREERVERLENVHAHWSALRKHALGLQPHVRRHGELEGRLARIKVRGQAARLRDLARCLDPHRRAAATLGSELGRLRKDVAVRACTATLNASRTWCARQRQWLTARKTARSSGRRLLISQVESMLAASSAGLELQLGRLAKLHSWQAGRSRVHRDRSVLGGHHDAAAKFKQELLSMKSQTVGKVRAALEADLMRARVQLSRHGVDMRVAGALRAGASQRAWISRVVRALPGVYGCISQHRREATRLRISAAALELRRGPARRAAVMEAAAEVDRLEFVPLRRSRTAGGKFYYQPTASADSIEELRMAEVFRSDLPVQAAYERKWHAMTAALSQYAEQSRECPFEFEADLIRLKRAGIDVDLHEAVLAGNDDPEVEGILQFHATRWMKIEAERRDARDKKAAAYEKARGVREKRIQLVYERIDRPARPGSFSDRARAAIRQDVRDLGAALITGGLALERDGDSYVFRSDATVLADATARLFRTAAGRAAIELLHWAVVGRQPHADVLAMAWTRRAQSHPDLLQQAPARPDPGEDIGAEAWTKPGAEMGG